MRATRPALEVQLTASVDEQAHIDKMNALAWELRERDPHRAFTLSESACTLSRQGPGDTPSYPLGLAYSLAHLGYLNHYKANYNLALSQSLDALALFEQLEHVRGIPRTLTIIGLTYLRLGKYAEALQHQHEALQLAKDVDDQTSEAKALNCIGLVHIWLRDHQEALGYFYDALHMYQHVGDTNGQCTTLTNLCMSYRDLHAYDKSLEYGMQCLELCQASHNLHRESMALNNLGMTYVALEHFDNARTYFHQALNIIDRIDDAFVQVSVLLNIGKSYLTQQLFTASQRYLHKALRLAEASDQHGFQFECHEALAASYKAQGDFATALHHFERFHTIKEQIFNEENTNKIKNLEILHHTETARHEAEIYRLKTAALEQEIAEHTRQEALFRGLVETAPDAIVIVDTSGHIVLVNGLAETLFGYTRKDLLGHPIEILLPPDVRSNHRVLRQQYLAHPRSRPIDAGRELYGQRKDGSTFPAEISLSPLQTADGLVISSTIRDLTARKQAEAVHQRLEAQLRQTHKLEALGTLAGGIAHDFNNILAAIMGFTELATLELTPDNPVQPRLHMVLEASHRARDLIQQILLFSHRGEQARRAVSCQQIAHEVLRLMRASLPSTIEIVSHCSVDTLSIVADPSQIHQVLMNLCTNATHAMRTAEGILTVQVESCDVDASFARQHPSLHPGLHARFTVQDTGHGIDAKTLERIFEPFFTTKPVGEGTGLGLAVVHGIITNHNGAITVESTVGVGTTFMVYLPCR